MPLYLTALNPTDAVTHGFLPAAARLGLTVVLLTDQPDAHRGVVTATPPAAVEECDVRDAAAVAAHVLGAADRHGRAEGLVSNSDHLQTATALAAELLGLPGKDWRATARCKNKSLTRRTLAARGLDTVASVEIRADDDPRAVAADLPFPAVLKPREGVASEDVVLVADLAELAARAAAVRDSRGDAVLVAEEYLAGELHTYETFGDAAVRRPIGSWHTVLGPPPFFTEARRRWSPVLPDAVVRDLDAQLTALGVGFGACHTEFVVDGDRARIIEVNYRLIGDTMDLIYGELLGVDLFAEVIRLHLGAPLSADLPDPRTCARHAHIEYISADGPGTLTAAPPDGREELPDGTVVAHRRLRELGVHAPWHGTNRDYLGVVHAIAPGASSAERAVTDYVGAHRWVVSP